MFQIIQYKIWQYFTLDLELRITQTWEYESFMLRLVSNQKLSKKSCKRRRKIEPLQSRSLNDLLKRWLILRNLTMNLMVSLDKMMVTILSLCPKHQVPRGRIKIMTINLWMKMSIDHLLRFIHISLDTTMISSWYLQPVCLWSQWELWKWLQYGVSVIIWSSTHKRAFQQ